MWFQNQEQEAVNHGSVEPTSHPNAFVWAQVFHPDSMYECTHVRMYVLVYARASVCRGYMTISNIIPKKCFLLEL